MLSEAKDDRPAESSENPMSTDLFKHSHGVIPACDVDSIDDLKRLVDQTGQIEGIVGYKLGLTGVLRAGLAGAVRTIRQHTDRPILYDHQKAGPDIPDMAGKFVALCREAGVEALILFPLAGPTAVRSFVGQAMQHGLLPIVGAALPLPDYLASDGGFVADDAPERVFGRAAELGVDHFIVPASSAAAVRRYVTQLRALVERPRLVMPGIGSLGGTVGDAFTAAAGCPAYAIVGRAIYASPDPAEAARRLADEALRFDKGG
jgi:orotidine-5'-phosphate decarboxylase